MPYSSLVNVSRIEKSIRLSTRYLFVNNFMLAQTQ